MTRRWIGGFGVLLGGLAFGALTVEIARRAPTGSFTGVDVLADFAFVRVSAVRAVLELGAGWALLAVGSVAVARGQGNRVGTLLVASSFAWFLTDWNNPATGSAVVFTAGLALSAAAPPFVGHLALAYPRGRLSSWLDRSCVIAAYTGALALLGFAAAFVYDGAANGCADCARNLLLVHDSPGLYSWLNRVGVYAGLGWSCALLLLIAQRLVGTTPALRRIVWPIATSAAAYLGLVAYDFEHSLGRGSLGADSTDRRLWIGEGVALIALAFGVAFGWVQGRRARTALVRLVVEVGDSPPPGGLGAVLGAVLGDPSVQLGYPLRDGRVVDALGRPSALVGEVTPLVRGEEQLALLGHRPGLFVDPDLVSAAGLALENERLHAEAHAGLADLRASRARVVAAGDSERRRLERNLHDGAQQGLTAFTLAVRHARSQVDAAADRARAARLDEADAELGAALEDLRKLAHGIYPAVLEDEGLCAALETLADETGIAITPIPDERFDRRVETAAYSTVLEVLRQTRSTRLQIAATRSGGCLTIDLEAEGGLDDPASIEDRVLALDGTFSFRAEPGGVKIRAEIPCVL